MFWHQQNLALPAFSRGFHLVTAFIEQALPELADINMGLLHVFIKHTSASLTINENADPDVPVDMESSL
ncbi:MAG: YjbQ family protein, partial [Planctomycetaceae bacterium]|nr:YjbQ family protein [Planctomycetaceae bacterium]